MKNLSIVLISDNKTRELPYLRHLKKVLIEILDAEVTIIGSLAEIQRVYYLLGKICPQVVIMSQIFEKSCQSLAQYIRDSGSQLVVIPCELRISPAYQLLVKNKSISLDEYVDILLLPGRNLQILFDKTNIKKDKIYVTGSPKIDLSTSHDTRLSRKKFCATNGIPTQKKNIFLFTSFITTDEDFLKQDKLYSNQLQFKQKFSNAVTEVRLLYKRELLNLANCHQELTFIVKPHPLEKISYSKIVKQAKNKNIYVVRSPLEDCYQSIDLAVHWISTVALECWLNEIPVIEFFLVSTMNYCPIFKRGIR